ncbi:MAG: hypothetical protein LBF66_02460 [Holosporales bacterium]|nr:hypothetical protein [Holosporales bacterium]
MYIPSGSSGFIEVQSIVKRQKATPRVSRDPCMYFPQKLGLRLLKDYAKFQCSVVFVRSYGSNIF